MSKKKYASDIILGEKYRDEQTGYEGTATALYFFQYGCERVTIETLDPGRKQLVQETFDAPRLVHVETGKRATVTRTGGPDKSVNAVRGPVGVPR